MSCRCVLLVYAALACGAAAGAGAVGKPSVGDALEYGVASSSYLGRNRQVVGVIQPGSVARRVLDKKTGQLVGTTGRKGMSFWVKKRDWNPFRGKRPSFKVRLLKEDPVGAMLSLAEEGKIAIEQRELKGGKQALTVSLIKPKPWYRRFL